VIAWAARTSSRQLWCLRGADNTAMQLAGKVLVHQVHPVKIGVDVTASVASNILLWTAWPKTGLAVPMSLPAVGSLAVLRRVGLGHHCGDRSRGLPRNVMSADEKEVHGAGAVGSEESVFDSGACSECVLSSQKMATVGCGDDPGGRLRWRSARR
jgi:hypothetical protein